MCQYIWHKEAHKVGPGPLARRGTGPLSGVSGVATTSPFLPRRVLGLTRPCDKISLSVWLVFLMSIFAGQSC